MISCAPDLETTDVVEGDELAIPQTKALVITQHSELSQPGRPGSGRST